MGITNQQIADQLSQLIEVTSAHTQAFIAAVDAMIANDNRHHAEIRAAIAELLKDWALDHQILMQHSENWGKVYKLLIGAVAVPIVTTLLQLILK